MQNGGRVANGQGKCQMVLLARFHEPLGRQVFIFGDERQFRQRVKDGLEREISHGIELIEEQALQFDRVSTEPIDDGETSEGEKVEVQRVTRIFHRSVGSSGRLGMAFRSPTDAVRCSRAGLSPSSTRTS